MKRPIVQLMSSSAAALAIAGSALAAAPTTAPTFYSWAMTPPMGWNSWDCFATTVTESQTKTQADYMAEHLKSHGWQYVVVDIQWYEPAATGFEYRKDAPLIMDEFGRLMPAKNRFPSSADGSGFKALADYVHSKGLKFGIHMLRGIPRQAVQANTPIKGTPYHAADIAVRTDICEWNGDMYGVDMSKPGGQAYYDSLLQLVASWNVDFVKVDDLSRPYHQAEIEGIRRAIDKTGRPIVFSTSPGITPLSAGKNVEANANMWRISDDFWDKWSALHAQFKRLADWTPYRAAGHFPDADMLPLGTLDLGRRQTHFTPDEQRTMMTLWAIARSPLMLGADMTKLDDATFKLLTNDDVIAVNQKSENGRQLFSRDGLIAWAADVPQSQDRYVALFNTTDGAHDVQVDLADLPIAANQHLTARDLWSGDPATLTAGRLAAKLPAHGSALFRLSVQP